MCRILGLGTLNRQDCDRVCIHGVSPLGERVKSPTESGGPLSLISRVFQHQTETEKLAKISKYFP